MSIIFIIIGILIIVSLIASEFGKKEKDEVQDKNLKKSKLRCPICNERMGIHDLSNAKFNYKFICKLCIIKIQEKYGDKPLNNIYLEDFQSAVYEYNINRQIEIDDDGNIFDINTGEIIKKR